MTPARIVPAPSAVDVSMVTTYPYRTRGDRAPYWRISSIATKRRKLIVPAEVPCCTVRVIV